MSTPPNSSTQQCRASENPPPETSAPPPSRNIIEHVMLLKMPVDLPVEQEQELLDHLYTLQYHYKQILCVSLGRVFSKMSDGYTHGVVFRLPSRSALDGFLVHPALHEAVQKYVEPFCQGRLTLSYEAPVPDDIEAVFRRGEEFESGIEHLVFVKPKGTATEEQKANMLTAVRDLPAKIGASVIQLTAGEILNGLSDFSHALIVRLSSEEDLAAYNRHPAHREVIRKHLLPVAERILAVDFSVDPVGHEKNV